MTYLRKYKKELLAIGMFILYFILSDFILGIILALGLDVSNTSQLNRQIISVLINLAFPILLILVYRKELFADLKKIKSNYRKYLEVGITYYAVGLVGMIVLNVFLQFFLHLGIAGNEESVRELLKISPIYMFISACLIAPFQEEMLFRKLFKDMFKNKIFFIIFSGLIFGSMHVVGSFTSYTDILFLLPYGFLGSMFALIYTKTDNIFVPIMIHFIHNTFLVLLQINIF